MQVLCSVALFVHQHYSSYRECLLSIQRLLSTSRTSPGNTFSKMVVSEFKLRVRALEFLSQTFDWSKSQLLLIFTTTKWVLILYKVALNEDYSSIMLNSFCVANK